MFRSIALWLLLCSVAFSQSKLETEFVPFDNAIIAKSAIVEQLDDGVAVFLVDRVNEERTGGFLTIKSQMKWATPYSEATALVETKQPDRWMMLAPPGKYKILIIEFDPDKRPKLTQKEVTVPGAKPPVDKPPASLESLIRLTQQLALEVNDKTTAQHLSRALLQAVGDVSNIEKARESVKLARIAVLQQRQGESRKKDWSTVLNKIDVAIESLQVSTVEGYVAAIKAVANAFVN